MLIKDPSMTAPLTDIPATYESHKTAKVPYPDAFEVFWRSFPKRSGSNPKKPARAMYERLIREGEVTEDQLLDAACKTAKRDRDKVGTPYLPEVLTWLRQGRWDDFNYSPIPQLPPGQNNALGVFVEAETEAWRAWAARLGRTPPMNRSFGWFFPTEYPPENGL